MPETKEKNITNRKPSKKNTKWKINLRNALEKRGVENGNALWLKIGGSKETAYDLFNGRVKMIRLETLDRLEEAFGISPYEILVKDETGK